MANTKSALKAARKTERQTIRNKGVKTRLKTYASAMDRATKSGIIHRNAASRAKAHVAKAMAK
jgi:small subunit ribosomal protein S20